ncbi:MAG: SMP-30/gluconolactonase/LRE family protein [Pseudomonadales bacterium]|jgi:sugar lactone lactonase YvrE|nr:SMP-30/gluconolactonase/LRE family protein [Pseudomonadales bacterium]
MAPRTHRTEVVAEGLRFGEGPRWYEGRLWFSDMHDGWVCALAPDGTLERVVHVAHEPSGLGWLPDGRLLVVSMQDRRLLRREADGSLVEHADLSALATHHCNDMVVDDQGRAYVGNFGFDLHGGAAPTTAAMVRVDADGSVCVAAPDLMFPNGTVITPDGATLVVGESFGGRLTAFDIDAKGALTNRRVWAQLPEGAVPDGICLDAEGAIWVASPTTNECLRIRNGGEVTDRVELDRGAFACMLGDDDRRTLYICSARDSDPAKSEARTARIERVRVDIPGAGLP